METQTIARRTVIEASNRRIASPPHPSPEADLRRRDRSATAFGYSLSLLSVVVKHGTRAGVLTARLPGPVRQLRRRPPDRFVGHPPTPPALPRAACINKPRTRAGI